MRASTDPAQALDGRDLRQAMGHFATGVTVVTASDRDGTARGATVNAVTSVSLEPPLVLVCLRATSRTLAALVATQRFRINVLRHDQERLARRFATQATSDVGDAAEPAIAGPPRLRDALATVDCALHDLADGGDHRIVVGRVLAVDHPSDHVEPLLFYRGRFAAGMARDLRDP
jgi:3-hydroxy-9,10-secoandrosta-1,3,5(10)-triene-9,17-dione monooxygenase reductase component